MSYLNALITDLRDRKLWPIPLALVVALVAVPVVLSKSPAPVSSTHPSLGLGIASTQTGPTVTDASAPVQVPLAGGGRDPFVQQKLGGAKVAMAANPASHTVTVSSSGATNAAASSGSSFSVSTGTRSLGTSSGSTSGNGSYTGTGTTGGSPSAPAAPAKPAAPVAGLTADESYQVQIGVPQADGGFINRAYVRGSELPTAQQPGLVALGVSQDGTRAMFAVLPGTMVSGGGTCVPGPLDCEILSVAPNQTVDVALHTAGAPKSLGSFTVTAINVQSWPSTAVANKSRNVVNASGEQLLAHSGLQALSLFPYNPSLGVVVDQRNIQVGGN